MGKKVNGRLGAAWMNGGKKWMGEDEQVGDEWDVKQAVALADSTLLPQRHNADAICNRPDIFRWDCCCRCIWMNESPVFSDCFLSRNIFFLIVFWAEIYFEFWLKCIVGTEKLRGIWGQGHFISFLGCNYPPRQFWPIRFRELLGLNWQTQNPGIALGRRVDKVSIDPKKW